MEIKVHILLSDRLERNEYAFVAPLKANRGLLKELGIIFRVFFEATDRALDCEVLIISSRFARHQKLWSPPERVMDFLQNARQSVDRLIWADLADGTGTCQFQIIDLVDRYLKGSLLKDRSLYSKRFYANRYFADYYHQQMGVKDQDVGEGHLGATLHSQEQFKKLFLGWNQFYSGYSLAGQSRDRIFHKIKRIPSRPCVKFSSPQKDRPLLLNCRISTNYSRKTVAYQRKRLLELLAGRTPTERVSRKAYYHELGNSKYVLSPFGWGEVCYRDFEAVLCGAVLIKPDCSHMETWPNFYRAHETYLPFRWDFKNFNELIDTLEANYPESIKLAEEAQVTYQRVLYKSEGRREFASKFRNLIKEFARDDRIYQ